MHALYMRREMIEYRDKQTKKPGQKTGQAKDSLPKSKAAETFYNCRVSTNIQNSGDTAK